MVRKVDRQGSSSARGSAIRAAAQPRSRPITSATCNAIEKGYAYTHRGVRPPFRRELPGLGVGHQSGILEGRPCCSIERNRGDLAEGGGVVAADIDALFRYSPCRSPAASVRDRPCPQAWPVRRHTPCRPLSTVTTSGVSWLVGQGLGRGLGQVDRHAPSPRAARVIMKTTSSTSMDVDETASTLISAIGLLAARPFPTLISSA